MAKAQKIKKKWLVMLAILVLAVLYFTFSQQSNKQGDPQYNIEKTGGGAVVDFTGATNKMHKIVDTALDNVGLPHKVVQDTVKEVPRQNVEGIIRWHTRQVLTTMSPKMSAEAVEKAINDAGGKVLSSTPDTYQGMPVVRLDIGIRDKLVNEDITIISDRIYLAREKLTALDAKPDSKMRGQIAIVIDDFGYNKETIDAFSEIARPLTFAVLPYRPFSNEAAARGISSGHQVILHLPMEPLNQGDQSEKLTITVSMSRGEIEEMVTRAIQSVPGIIGVNNHQGSRVTGDRRAMQDVIRVLKGNNLFFLDSRTSSQSVGAEIARQMGVKTRENELFIDNDNDVSAVKSKLRTAQDMAIKHGTVTVIGHARMTTATAVRELISEFESNGIQFVFVSEIVK